MLINNDFLIENDFEVDVEMNLSVHYTSKDGVIELTDYSETLKDSSVKTKNYWEIVIRKENDIQIVTFDGNLSKLRLFLEFCDLDYNHYFPNEAF